MKLKYKKNTGNGSNENQKKEKKKISGRRNFHQEQLNPESENAIEFESNDEKKI